MLNIFFTKVDPNAKEPFCSYNGTSAGFDLCSTKTVTIEPRSSAVIPNGLRLTISQDENFYMMVHARSSFGFKKEIVCHPGVIDAGYTGNLGVKFYNLGDEPITIKEGERYAQLTVHKKFDVNFVELSSDEFSEFEKLQERGKGGFGSSNPQTTYSM